jgi:2-iminobutanoate/2-iminopropanoate deaminase
MKPCFALLLVLLTPAFASAQQPDRLYFSSPLAQQRHLPFSSGVLVGNTLYVAGTTGIDPATKGSVTLTQEAHLVMDRVKHVVEEAGLTMGDLVSVQVYCTDLRDYAAFNSVYKTFFHAHYPARAFIGASSLLFGAHFEVMGIAEKPTEATR